MRGWISLVVESTAAVDTVLRAFSTALSVGDSQPAGDDAAW